MSQKKVKKPDRNAAAKKKLSKAKQLTSAEIQAAMKEASDAIDRLSSELAALRRIVIAERAQLIYMTDLTVGYASGKILDIVVKGFHELPEEKQQEYVKRAIAELGSDQAIIPHKVEGAEPGKADAEPAKKGKIEIVH